MKNGNHTKPARPEIAVAEAHVTGEAAATILSSQDYGFAGRRIVESDELKTLFRLARPAITPALAIAAFAGLRFAELRALDWKDVRLEDGCILAPSSAMVTTKNRLVPISGNLDAWLRPAARTEGLVARSIDLRSEVHRIAMAIGIDRPFTALRRSFVVYRGAVTGDLNTVSMETGIPPLLLRLSGLEVPEPERGHGWQRVPHFRKCLMANVANGTS